MAWPATGSPTSTAAAGSVEARGGDEEGGKDEAYGLRPVNAYSYVLPAQAGIDLRQAPERYFRMPQTAWQTH